MDPFVRYWCDNLILTNSIAFSIPFGITSIVTLHVFAKQCAIRIDKQQKERYNNVVIDNDVII